MTLRRTSILLGMGLLVISATRAQKLAPYAGEFLSIGAGARSLAMGGAYAALASDASGGYWNPAALTGVTHGDVMLMHEEKFAGLINYDLGAAAFTYGENTSIGITVLRLGLDEIKDSRGALVDMNGNGELDAGEYLDYSRITYTNASDWAVIASYAHRSSEELSYGVSVKLIRRSVAEFSATGVGFDAGVMYLPVPELRLAAVASDVTTTLVAWSTGRTELISPTLRTAAAYELSLGSFTLTPAVQCAIRFEGRGTSAAASIGPVSFDPSAGAEVCYDDVVSLRGGIDEIGSATLGAGLQIKRLSIDYAFTGFGGTSELGQSHRLSLRLGIDSPF